MLAQSLLPVEQSLVSTTLLSSFLSSWSVPSSDRSISNDRLTTCYLQVALISSLIFKITDKNQHTQLPGGPSGPTYNYYGKNGVGWVLRFGGLLAFVGLSLISFRLQTNCGYQGWCRHLETGSADKDGEGNAMAPSRDEGGRARRISLSDISHRLNLPMRLQSLTTRHFGHNQLSQHQIAFGWTLL